MAKSKGIICVVILLLFSFQLNAASTSPSQTVPKVLEEIEKEKIKKLDNQEFFNGLKNIKKEEEKIEQISVVVKSLVIIASEELQNIFDFDTYKKQLKC